ncbi:hypothetical protein BASA83_013021 [Batrachochytrium salamandrivorans]|nr:hypothetical protein BASA83_013021 [Batrachochytrium salamandrivorans]
MSGPKAQAEAMRKRNGFDENTPDYYFQRSSTSERCNQADLAPWLAPVIDNVDFFYDGTNRNSSLDS